MNTAVIASLQERGRALLPGLSASIVVAAAAAFLAEHYRAPLMLLALLLGMSMNFLATQSACKPGIDLAARGVLRIGVALLGVRITFEQIAQLGWAPLLAGRGVRDRHDPGLDRRGAAARLQQAVRLPDRRRHRHLRRFGGTGIVGRAACASWQGKGDDVHHHRRLRRCRRSRWSCTRCSSHLTGLSPVAAGVFLGGSIHEVAQVVGAGYSMSRETGDVATIVKLLRVAMLLPVIICAAMITRAQADSKAGDSNAGPRPPLLPWFAVAFLVVAAVNSAGWIGESVQSFGNELSRGCLAVAMSAIGMNTQLKEIIAVGFKPIALMIGEAVFLAGLVLFLSWWLH